ncbi:MAG: hypothetical protein K0Q74_1165 [Gammaproteobacteria bacterium]|jgi:hypothetical protein|nr:hypothetical protein [Gammaproteobacteria bacterium]
MAEVLQVEWQCIQPGGMLSTRSLNVKKGQQFPRRAGIKTTALQDNKFKKLSPYIYGIAKYFFEHII